MILHVGQECVFAAVAGVPWGRKKKEKGIGSELQLVAAPALLSAVSFSHHSFDKSSERSMILSLGWDEAAFPR